MTRRRLPPALSFRLFSAIALMLSVMAPKTPALAQEPVHWEVASRIRAEGFENSRVLEYTAYLSDVIGPRITASPAMRQAQSWIMGRMEEMGLARVHMEPWGEHTVGWDMERVSVHMLEPDYQMVIGYPLAGTKRDHESFSVYFNMDNGTGRFRGVHLQGNTLATPIFEAWMKPFHDLEVRTLSRFSNRGTDHLAFDEAGLPGFQFVQDRLDYRAQ